MNLEQGKWYEVIYDDGTKLLGMFVKRERGFIEFQLGDGGRLICRTHVRTRPSSAPDDLTAHNRPIPN